METSFKEKILELFQILYFTCRLPGLVEESYKIKGPNIIICLKCDHKSSFQNEGELIDDLEELAKEHAIVEHGEEILKEYLKDFEELYDSEKPIAIEYLSKKITLEEFTDKMISNARI